MTFLRRIIRWLIIRSSLVVYRHGFLQTAEGSQNRRGSRSSDAVVVYAFEPTKALCMQSFRKLYAQQSCFRGFRLKAASGPIAHVSKEVHPIWRWPFWRLLATRTVCEKCPTACDLILDGNATYAECEGTEQ
jgi:hypothetical protein